jgi:hypothetical protein
MKNEQILTNNQEIELENFKMPITLNEEKDIPVNYFDQFPNQLLEKIHQSENVKKTAKYKIIHIASIGKYAVAASVLLIIASTYYLVTPNKILTPSQQEASIKNISLQEISTEEIESYVDNYEFVNEADMQMEISKIGATLETNKISNDSAN